MVDGFLQLLGEVVELRTGVLQVSDGRRLWRLVQGELGVLEVGDGGDRKRGVDQRQGQVEARGLLVLDDNDVNVGKGNICNLLLQILRVLNLLLHLFQLIRGLRDPQDVEVDVDSFGWGRLDELGQNLAVGLHNLDLVLIQVCFEGLVQAEGVALLELQLLREDFVQLGFGLILCGQRGGEKAGSVACIDGSRSYSSSGGDMLGTQ